MKPPPTPPATADPWLDTAAAMRIRVLEHGCVLRLGRGRRHETRGRGGVVQGVALTEDEGGVRAHIGVVLHGKCLERASVTEVAEEIAADVCRWWHKEASIGSRPFVAHIEVIDLEVPLSN